MKLVIGLGNPGKEYQNTRHNVGYLLTSALKVKKIPGLVAKKTNTFMNSSGLVVKKMLEKYKTDPKDLYVAHDDLDIALGEYKIQRGRGPKDHKGLKSIYKELGTRDFWHIRIGVENRNSEKKIVGEEYVLQDFKNEEQEKLEKVIHRVCKKLAQS